MLYIKYEDLIRQHMENAMGAFTFFFSHSYLTFFFSHSYKICKRKHWKYLFSFNLLIHSSSVMGHLLSQHLTFIWSFSMIGSVCVCVKGDIRLSCLHSHSLFLGSRWPLDIWACETGLGTPPHS